MDNLIIGESSSALGAVALVLVMVVFVIPMGYKLWRKYYFGITAANEAAWSEVKASMHNKDATPKPTDTNKTNEDDFDIHTKSLIKDHIKDTDKTKYWTNYFLIFSLIMLAQLIYAVSHLLNQYYGVPSIGNIESTTVQGTAIKAVFVSILLGVYIYKRRGLKDKQALLHGIEADYGLECKLTLDKLEKLDLNKGKKSQKTLG